MAKTLKYFVFGITSSLLAAIAYSYPEFGFLIWVAFIPFFWGLTRLNFSGKKIDGFLYGLISGTAYFLLIFRWFWGLYPLDIYGIGSVMSILIIGLLWLITSASLGLFWGIFGLLTHILSKKRLFDFLFLGALFSLLEFTRSFAINLTWYGQGALIGPHWTFGNPVYALSHSQFILTLSSYIGIYGLTFIIILFNLIAHNLIGRFLHKHHSFFWEKYLSIITLGLIILGITIIKPVGLSKNDGREAENIRFSVIQTRQTSKISDSPREILANFHAQSELFLDAIRANESDVIIFPEGSNFFKNLSGFLKPAQIKNYFEKLSKNSKLIIDNSRINPEKKQMYSRVTYLNTKDDIIGYYDKKLLTPAGEFLPYSIEYLLKFILGKNRQTLASINRLKSGQDDRPAIFNNIVFESAVCSDFFSPSIIRDKARKGAILIGMGSTAMFQGNKSLVSQNLAINRFRAAENQIPIVFASNYGLSYVIDVQGNTTKIAPNQDSQIFTGNVLVSTSKSWYNKLGDWPSLILMLIILLAFLAKRACEQKN